MDGLMFGGVFALSFALFWVVFLHTPWGRKWADFDEDLPDEEKRKLGLID